MIRLSRTKECARELTAGKERCQEEYVKFVAVSVIWDRQKAKNKGGLAFL